MSLRKLKRSYGLAPGGQVLQEATLLRLREVLEQGGTCDASTMASIMASARA